MKLGKVTSNDPVGRQPINFHQSTTAQLQAYRAYYQQTYGDEISLSQLVEEIAKRFLKEDKDFQKFFAKKNPATGAVPAPAATAAQPAAVPPAASANGAPVKK